jgi:hypothetical protein
MQQNPKPEVRFGDWIGEGWRMFTEQWQTWVLLMLVLLLIILAPVGVLVVVALGLATATAGTQNAGLPLLFFPLMLASVFFIMAAVSYMTGGLYRAAFKQLRGGRVELRDLFSGGDRALPVLGASLLIAILTMIGAILCVIPAYIVMGLFFFTVPLIIERGMGVGDAMRTSYEMGKQNILMFTLFAFVVGLISQIGAYACYVGLLATFPLQFTITAVAYRDLFGLEGARSFLGPASQMPSPYAQPSPYAPPPSAYTPPSYAPPPPYAPSAPQPRSCRNCHASLPETATFCPRCGTPADV